MQPARTIETTRRLVSSHRRLLAAGFAAASVAGGLYAVSPPSPATSDVVVAAADLPAGAAVTSDQLETRAVPEERVPEGSLGSVEDAAGRRLAAPVRSGEPLTDVRFVGAALVDGYGDGRVAAPVRVADAGAAQLLRTGDRVDVLAADPQGSAETAVVAPDARVIVVPEPDDATQSASGALVVLAVTPETAKKLSQAAVVGPLSVSIRG